MEHHDKKYIDLRLIQKPDSPLNSSSGPEFFRPSKGLGMGAFRPQKKQCRLKMAERVYLQNHPDDSGKRRIELSNPNGIRGVASYTPRDIRRCEANPEWQQLAHNLGKIHRLSQEISLAAEAQNSFKALPQKEKNYLKRLKKECLKRDFCGIFLKKPSESINKKTADKTTPPQMVLARLRDRKFAPDSDLFSPKVVADSDKQWEKNYEDHSSFFHKKQSTYRCKSCEKVLLSKSSLKLHSRIHTNEKPYKCEDCGQSFRWCTSFKNHLKNHKKNLPQCPVAACSRRFSLKTRLESHFQSVHIQMLEAPDRQ